MRKAAPIVWSVELLRDISKSVVSCLYSPEMLHICPMPDSFRLLNSSHSLPHGSVKGISNFREKNWRDFISNETLRFKKKTWWCPNHGNCSMNQSHIMSLLSFSVEARCNAPKQMPGANKLILGRCARHFMAPGHRIVEIAEKCDGQTIRVSASRSSLNAKWTVECSVLDCWQHAEIIIHLVVMVTLKKCNN